VAYRDGGGRGNRTDARGNPYTFCALYESEKGPGLVGYLELQGKKFQVFVTHAKNPKKENHRMWCTLTHRVYPGGGRGRG